MKQLLTCWKCKKKFGFDPEVAILEIPHWYRGPRGEIPCSDCKHEMEMKRPEEDSGPDFDNAS